MHIVGVQFYAVLRAPYFEACARVLSSELAKAVAMGKVRMIPGSETAEGVAADK